MKNRFQKILTSNVFYFILGGLIFTSIGVGASTLYNANQVSYNNTSSSVKDVKGALDDLYSSNASIDKSIAALNITTNENRTASVKKVAFTPTKDCSQIVIGGRRYGGAFNANILNENDNVLATTSISATAAAEGVNTASYITLNTVQVELKKGVTYYLSSQGQGTGYSLYSFVIYP